jgi:hypothetical protein
MPSLCPNPNSFRYLLKIEALLWIGVSELVDDIPVLHHIICIAGMCERINHPVQMAAMVAFIRFFRRNDNRRLTAETGRSGPITPSCMPVRETAVLNIEPGGYFAITVRSRKYLSGCVSSRLNSCPRSCVITGRFGVIGQVH